MVPPPIALGLILCDLAIAEQGTGKVSLIGTFATFRARNFPFTPNLFYVYASLTDGVGAAEATLLVTALDTNEDVYEVRRAVTFPDRLADVRLLFRLAACTFRREGIYQFTLLIDGEWVAHRRIRVFSVEALG